MMPVDLTALQYVFGDDMAVFVLDDSDEKQEASEDDEGTD